MAGGWWVWGTVAVRSHVRYSPGCRGTEVSCSPWLPGSMQSLLLCHVHRKLQGEQTVSSRTPGRDGWWAPNHPSIRLHWSGMVCYDYHKTQQITVKLCLYMYWPDMDMDLGLSNIFKLLKCVSILKIQNLLNLAVLLWVLVWHEWGHGLWCRVLHLFPT